MPPMRVTAFAMVVYYYRIEALQFLAESTDSRMALGKDGGDSEGVSWLRRSEGLFTQIGENNYAHK
jgi:hypothetical protein